MSEASLLVYILLLEHGLANLTFTQKARRSGDISVAVKRTECNFCCVINLNSYTFHLRFNSLRIFTSWNANINGARNAHDDSYCNLIECHERVYTDVPRPSHFSFEGLACETS